MRPLAYLGLAWRSIRGHPLRSSLTTLGVVIGVAAVIAFVALGASLQAGILGDLSPDDQRNLYGWAADPDVEGGPGAGAQPVFSDDDVQRVSELEDVEAAYGYATIQTQGLTYEGERVAQGDAMIASGPTYIRPGQLREGRQFESGEREAVLNPAAAGLFEEEVAVGDELTITIFGGQRTTVEVVGITDTSEGMSPFEGFEAAPRVYVPTDPFYAEGAGGLAGAGGDGDGDDDGGDGGDGDGGESDGANGGGDGEGGESDVEGGGNDGGTDDGGGDGSGAAGDDGSGAGGLQNEDPRYLAIVVEAESAADADIDRAREAAISYLESDESDASELMGDELAVTMQTSTELLQQLEDVLGLLQDFIVGVAAISLLVGSIGIANIMLVSVTERTREIGIMKAVGAQNRDVLALFLTESIVLGVVGAVAGTALGLVAGYIGAWYIDLPLVYPLEYVVLAIAVGIGVGVLSGLYPAWRAARTDPIDALRYE